MNGFDYQFKRSIFQKSTFIKDIHQDYKYIWIFQTQPQCLEYI